MSIEIKVPMLPESVADATVATWHKKAGDAVKRDENLVDLETDKVMLEVPSPVDGVIKEILKPAGEVVQANQVLAIIEAGAAAQPQKESAPQQAAVATAAPQSSSASQAALSPSVRRIAAEHEVDVSQVKGTGKGGRITKENVIAAVGKTSSLAPSTTINGREEKRVPMTRIRARIAERLLEVRQSTAMLTTFNEINLQQVIDLRNRYKDKFEKVHHARLGFMSFLLKPQWKL